MMTDEVFIRETGVEDCEHLEVCEHACRARCRSYKPRVNRDALLALADECGDASRAYDGDGHELTSRQFANVARRIREALGVKETKTRGIAEHMMGKSETEGS